jgi:hypothetical protein
VLALRATGADGEIVSEQTVSIAVPQRGGQQAVAVLAAPNKPTVVLSQPAAPLGSSGSELRIASVEALQGGSMFASGSAPPGANLRIYLNESYVASVEAGADGKWSIRVERGMSSGSYRVRADRVGADGKAISRVEAPFDYPAELARQIAEAQASGAAPVGGAPQSASEQGSASEPAKPDRQKAATRKTLSWLNWLQRAFSAVIAFGASARRSTVRALATLNSMTPTHPRFAIRTSFIRGRFWSSPSRMRPNHRLRANVGDDAFHRTVRFRAVYIFS